MNTSFITKDTKITMYIPIPLGLLKSDFSSTTLLIYGTLLNRALLSQKNGWCDTGGNVYVVYPIAELSQAVGKGLSTVKASLEELQDKDLIYRYRVDLYTTHIYVKLPDICPSGQDTGSLKSSYRTLNGQNAGLSTAGKPTTNNNKDIQNINTNKYIYEEGESF